MDKEAVQNIKDIEAIKMALALGYISYDEAKKEAEPILCKINAKGRKIAQKYNKPYYKVTFSELIR